MSYDLLTPGLYSPARPKPKKIPRLLTYLVLSIIMQLSFFYGLEIFFKNMSGIELEPTTSTEVQERKISPNPPLYSPEMMAISADRSMLAVTDSDQLRIYDLSTGTQILKYHLASRKIGAMEWLPDRNRLVFALIDTKLTANFIKSPIQGRKTTVFDETYSTDTYRQSGDPQITANEHFQIAVYSLEGVKGASPTLIQSLNQTGPSPQKIGLSSSTYTNLLFVHWIQPDKDTLVQIDIMNRVKDFSLPKGRLTKLVVSPRDGNLWVEMTEDNSASIYLYQKGRWKLKTYLDGYRLLGVTHDESLAVAPDQNGQAKEVQIVNGNGDFKQGWVFSEPLELANVRILKDGRLLYLDNGRVIIHSSKLGEGTLFNTETADCHSSDGKMVLSWLYSSNELQILEEVEQEKQK